MEFSKSMADLDFRPQDSKRSRPIVGVNSTSTPCFPSGERNTRTRLDLPTGSVRMPCALPAMLLSPGKYVEKEVLSRMARTSKCIFA
jgi:hypothetical protein